MAYHLNKLRKQLSYSDPQQFMTAIWCTWLLGGEEPELALKFFYPNTVPRTAIGKNADEVYKIHPWELETLVCVFLATPNKIKRPFPPKILNLRNFQNMIDFVNRLRKVENSEDRIDSPNSDILDEVTKLAHRQFGWQSRLDVAANFYRALFVYGQGRCAKYFEDEHGLPLDRFVFIAFAIYVIAHSSPSINTSKGLPELSISDSEIATTLNKISIPYNRAVPLARKLAQGRHKTAFAPSILRQYPCVSFPAQEGDLKAPLPQLIMERVTSGLFYDIIKFNGAGDDFGPRFEQYCMSHFDHYITEICWKPEFRYGPKNLPRDTPDILGFGGNRLKFVIECKARRMPHSAKFGDGPDNANGLADIAKGMAQIWRFHRDLRTGLLKLEQDQSVASFILTMDDWGLMGINIHDAILQAAQTYAEHKGWQLTEEDRKPVHLIEMKTFERILASASAQSLSATFMEADKLDMKWSSIEEIHGKHSEKQHERHASYPYKKMLKDILPWWDSKNLKQHFNV